MEFLEVSKHFRGYDNKWETIARILDHDNSYSFKSEDGRKMTIIPEKWITINVTSDEPNLEILIYDQPKSLKTNCQ